MRLTRRGLEPSDDSSALTALSERFRTHHVVALPGFLGDDLRDVIERGLSVARFSVRVENGVEIEDTLDDEGLMGMMLFTLNDSALFSVIDAVSGCGPIGCFTGRVYRRHQSDGVSHHYPWHDDNCHDRLVGLSINLGREHYVGGVLQIRDALTKAPISEMANPVMGDAMIFRISSAIEHQVTPVTGSGYRLVLAGWFCRTPLFADQLHGRA